MNHIAELISIKEMKAMDEFNPFTVGTIKIFAKQRAVIHLIELTPPCFRSYGTHSSIPFT